MVTSHARLCADASYDVNTAVSASWIDYISHFATGRAPEKGERPQILAIELIRSNGIEHGAPGAGVAAELIEL
jgi:hypothetical protein